MIRNELTESELIFDEIVVTICTGSCHFDNFLCTHFSVLQLFPLRISTQVGGTFAPHRIEYKNIRRVLH